jgi:glycine cleavage system aminomethyltransferase T
VVSGAAVTNRDLDWLSRNIPDDAHCFCTDVTAAWAVLGVMGPGSRALLEKITSADLSNSAFPFATTQQVEIGCAVGRAFRVSYVGELGWELYIPSDQARHAYDVVLEAGADHGLVPAGMHALDSCRIEKKFVHFGHDVADEDTPVDAGMRFVCQFDKPIHFIGRDAVLAQLDEGRKLERRLVQFLLQDPDAMLYHHEPILRDGTTVGFLTSGNYGHSLGGSVGLGYVRCEDGVDSDYIAAGKWQIDVAGVPVAAKASLRALYDPKGERARV